MEHTKDIIEYYNHYDEMGRLKRDRAHAVEFMVTTHFFDRLIKPKSHILDACAGTGVYSFYLAEQGHCVTARDLTPRNVELIKNNPKAAMLKDVKAGNALDLSCFRDEAFDVVLLMGALYHLERHEHKQKAVNESMRVLKKGGLVALSYIPPFGTAMRLLADGFANVDFIETVYHNGLEVFYPVAPDEAAALAALAGAVKMYNIGLEGPLFCLGDKVKTATEINFKKWLDFYISVCMDESIIGLSNHCLYLGRKE